MKKLISILAVLTVISVPFLTGCTDVITTTISNSNYSLIEDITWVMESYGDPDDLTEALDNADFTLYLDSTEGTFTGSVGLNYYSGNYQLNDSELSFPDKTVAVTQLYVGEDIQQQQETYLHIFMNADSIEMVNGKLHVISDYGVVICHKQ